MHVRIILFCLLNIAATAATQPAYLVATDQISSNRPERIALATIEREQEITSWRPLNPEERAAYRPVPLPDSSRTSSRTTTGSVRSLTHTRATGLTVTNAEPPALLAQALFSSAGSTEPGQVSPAPSGPEPLSFGSLTKVTGPSNTDMRVACKIFVTYPNGNQYVGSGMLIDPYHVITCSHMVYNSSRGGLVTSIRVVPAYENGATPYGDANYRQVHYWTAWEDDFGYDLAVIDLDRPLIAVGWNGYGSHTETSFYTGNTFRNPGYPAATPYDGEWMYRWQGTMNTVKSRTLITSPHGYGGQSGSGCYKLDTRTVYAIHVAANESANQATFKRIVSSDFSLIKDWLEEDRAATFDLIAGYTTALDTQVVAGASISGFKYRLLNYGKTTFSGTVNIDVYLSDNPFITQSDILLDSRTVSTTLGEVDRLLINANDLYVPSTTKPGSYYLGVRIRNSDADTSNNASSYQDAWPIRVRPAVPYNDIFARARYLFDSGSIIGLHTETAGAEVGEPNHGGNSPAHSIWFAYVPSRSGHLGLNTHTSNYDTVLAVYTGATLTALTRVAGNDDNDGRRSSRINDIDVKRNTTYWIAIDSYRTTDFGLAALTWTFTPNIVGNDALSNATALALASGTVRTNNSDATTEATEPWSGQQTVWYRFTPAQDIGISLSTEGSGFNTTLALFEGADFASLRRVAHNDNARDEVMHSALSNLLLRAGRTYVVAVGSVYDDGGDVVLSWITHPYRSPDFFVNARTLTGGYADHEDSIEGFTVESGEPAHAGQAAHGSYWYRYTAPTNGILRVWVHSEFFSPRVAVYDGNTAANLTLLPSRSEYGSYGDAWTSHYVQVVDIGMRPGQSGLIAVDTRDGRTGPFYISVDFTPVSDRYSDWMFGYLDPSADDDADGISNEGEWLAGTDPWNHGSHISIDLDPRSMQLTATPTLPNRRYMIEHRASPDAAPVVIRSWGPGETPDTSAINLGELGPHGLLSIRVTAE